MYRKKRASSMAQLSPKMAVKSVVRSVGVGEGYEVGLGNFRRVAPISFPCGLAALREGYRRFHYLTRRREDAKDKRDRGSAQSPLVPSACAIGELSGLPGYPEKGEKYRGF